MFEGSGNREGAPDEDSFAPTAESILLEGLEQEDGASLGHFRCVSSLRVRWVASRLTWERSSANRLAFATLEEGPMRQVRSARIPFPPFRQIPKADHLRVLR